MWRRVAAFELRGQLRSPVFAVVFAISAALVAGSVLTPQLRVGPQIAGLRNGPEAVVQVLLVWSLFHLFTAAAFAADAVLRDELTGFAPVLRSTGVGRLHHLFGRFLGAFAAVTLAYLSVPLGLLLAGEAPWRDLARFGPAPWGAYVFGVVVIALPNLFLGSAVFLAVATLARSLRAAWLAAVALLVLYGLGGGLGPASAHRQAWRAVLEPFGFAATAGVGRAPVPTPVLLLNRAVWTGVGALALALAAWRFRFEAPARRPVAPASVAVAARPPAPRLAAPPPCQRFDARGVLAQWAARTRLEVEQAVGSPVFAVLLMLGFGNAAAALWALGPAPDTPHVLARLVEAFRLTPLVVVLAFAGELMWNEREHRVDGLVAAAPVGAGALVVPKLLALAVMLLLLLLASASTALAVQLARGGEVRPGLYWRWYLLPRAYDWLLPAGLAMFLQAVSPGKVAGWGWFVLYLLVSLTLEQLGLTSGLYRFGGHLDAPFSPSAGPVLPARAGVLRLYWAAVTLVLVCAACALWGRGGEVRLSDRIRGARVRMKSGLGALALAGLLASVTLGWRLVLRD